MTSRRVRKNLKGFYKNKKASLFDLIIMGVMLTVFAITILFGFKFINEFKTQISANPDIPARAVTAVTTLEGNYTGVLDSVFPFVAIGLAIATLILAALVRIHPIFIPLYFIGWLIIIFMSGIYSNIYNTIAADSNLTALAQQLTLTNLIMTYLPFVVGIVGILLMIIMYKTWQAEA